MIIRNAEMLAVGTELLLGEVQDTNSSFLAAELAAHSVDVYWSQRVGDNRARLEQAISAALGRSDLLVLTGGLGPTPDDLTREAIAAVLRETPAVDPRLEAELRSYFAGRARPMPEANLKQAWLIPSAEPLPNPLGTAPGWLVRCVVGRRERVIVALPGPPRELVRMWREEVLPRLELPPASLRIRTFKSHGLGESDIAERLGRLALGANPSVATYARRDGVHVRVATKAADPEEARVVAAEVEAEVAALLGEHVWGEDRDELPDLVIRRLRERGLTLATCEGPSGGSLGDRLSAVGDAEAVYRGGVVAWSPQAMVMLGLPRARALAPAGPEDAARMAEAVREAFAADVGVVTLGKAAPDGRQGAAADEVFVAVQASAGVVRRLALPPLDTGWRRERIAFATLFLLWSQLR